MGLATPMANSFGGEGSRPVGGRGGVEPSRLHPPAPGLGIVLTGLYALAVAAAGTLLPAEPTITPADLGYGVGALIPPLLAVTAARRRRKTTTAEPLPTLDVAELAKRIGAAVVDVEPEVQAPAPSGESERATPAPPAVASPAGLYDLQLFSVLALPRFQAARDSGSHCTIAVLGIDLWARPDAPVGQRTPVPLEGVARAIRGNLRGHDIAARYGNGEFVVFLDGCDRIEALRIVHRLAQSVFDLQTPAGRLSLSAGLAVFPDCGVDMHSLVQGADTVLREIRANGRSEIRLVVPVWTHGAALQTTPA
jgi:diguanylate cyclase (GGDEF)-like protein